MNFEEILNNTTDADILTALILSMESLNDESSEKDLKYKIKEKPIHEICSEGIENYIEAPCVNACKKLWDKNMFTKASVIDNEKISIVFDKLSKENETIFSNLVKEDNEHYCYSLKNEPRIQINFNNNAKENSVYLENLVEPFKLQDVTSGYMEKEEFLMKVCNCERVEGIKEHTKDWNAEFVFAPEKVEKTFNEYLKEYSYEDLFVPEEGRIYKDKFYLDAHKKYLNSIREKAEEQSKNKTENEVNKQIENKIESKSEEKLEDKIENKSDEQIENKIGIEPEKKTVNKVEIKKINKYEHKNKRKEKRKNKNKNRKNKYYMV